MTWIDLASPIVRIMIATFWGMLIGGSVVLGMAWWQKK